jgi:RND family efflux transporter MFP subunit
MGNPQLLDPSAAESLAPSVANGAAETEKRLPEPRRRGKWLWVLVVVLAFGGGWMLAGGSLGRREKESLPSDTAAGQRDPEAVVVTAEPVTFRPVQRAVEGVGTLYGFEEIAISARVEGRVRKLRFDVADRVKPGELLLEIDPTDCELAVEQAERALQVELARLGLTELPGADVDLGKVPSVVQAQTRMQNAKTKSERVRGLTGTGAISAEERDNLISDYRAAQADFANQLLLARAGLATIRMKQTALAVAQQQLKDTQVRVPTPTLALPDAADGVLYAVTHRSVGEGTLVRPGTEICKLVLNQTLKLRVPVPERYSTEVRPGQKVEIHVAAFPQPFAGAVTRINPAVEPATRTFEVEVQVPNPSCELKPGSFAKAAILTRLDGEAATVPLTALINFAGVNKVFLMENGRAREVPVTLGVQTTAWVEITSPVLPRGAQVITSGQTVLAADTPVAVRAATNDASSPARTNGG